MSPGVAGGRSLPPGVACAFASHGPAGAGGALAPPGLVAPSAAPGVLGASAPVNQGDEGAAVLRKVSLPRGSGELTGDKDTAHDDGRGQDPGSVEGVSRDPGAGLAAVTREASLPGCSGDAQGAKDSVNVNEENSEKPSTAASKLSPTNPTQRGASEPPGIYVTQSVGTYVAQSAGTPVAPQPVVPAIEDIHVAPSMRDPHGTIAGEDASSGYRAMERDLAQVKREASSEVPALRMTLHVSPAQGPVP